MNDEDFPLEDPVPTVNQLVSQFLSGEDITMNAAIFYPNADPEMAWEAILRIIKLELSEGQIATLAAGPVESLLSWQGPQFIDRIETEARRNPFFRNLLGGVWRQDMPDAIWSRVEAARGAKI